MASVGDFISVHTWKDGSNDWQFRWSDSSDGITWSGFSNLSISFSSADAIVSTDERRNPFLMQILSGGDLWLFFEVVEDVVDNQELSNIFYSTSSDNGSTWTEAVKLTSYTTLVAAAQHPTATQKTASTMHIMYDEFRNALTMDSSAAGWCGSPLDMTYSNSHWDADADRWYVQCSHAGGGVKLFHGVIEIDVDSWTITDCWNTSSVPAFDLLFDTENMGWYNTSLNSAPYIAMSNNGTRVIQPFGDDVAVQVSVLNYVTDTITHYAFADWDVWGITKNVSFTDHTPSKAKKPMPYFQIDSNTDRLYLGYTETPTGSTNTSVGYIDLTETISEGGSYTYNEIVWKTGWSVFSSLGMSIGADGGFQVFPEFDLIVVSAANTAFINRQMKTFSLSTGAIVKEYDQSTHSNFPYHSVHRGGVMMNVGGIPTYYGAFDYDATLPLAGGIIKITFSTDTFEYIKPTTSSPSPPVYYIKHIIKLDDDHIAMTAYANTDGGIYIMNVNDESWQLINNTSAPGLTEDGNNSVGEQLNYDPSRTLLLSGSRRDANWEGLIAVSQYGPLRKSYLITGTNSGSWSFDAATALVQGINDYNAVGEIDPVTSGLYAFWTSSSSNELSIKRDYEPGSVNLDPYISKDHEISVERFIDGTPSRLSFTVSHGHLFDPHNINSTLSTVLTKLNKVTLRFGELSGGTSYWQNQGTFIVVETSVSYERGNYPILQVDCEDKMSTWNHNIVIATDDYFDTDPDVALDEIIKAHSDFTTSTINLPAMNNKENINYQWIEMDLLSIVNQLTNRFGYYIRIDVDGKVNIKEIAEDNVIDQSYTDASQIIRFTPDDSFSDFTNKVIVTGEEITFSDKVFAEERMGLITGTVGWWGGKQIERLYYSKDRKRTARNPRLNVLKTVKSIGFKVAEIFGPNIDEGIEGEDPGEHWVETYIDVPLLTGLLSVAIGIIAGAIWKGNTNVHPGGGGGVTTSIPVGRAKMAVGILIAINVLGSVVNFQHEIWAQPVGKIRRSVQATADDDESQAKLGGEIVLKIDDPLCNTVSACQFVANFEMMIIRLQRKRVKFTKVANMLDEDGDTIQIVHPHTGDTLDIFITQLVRRMQIGDASSKEERGHFLDDIEGWVV
jgi:hypothetical protein